ncbi:hypothetical protein HDU76_003765 [Blyttiomyces sp. JEL0837]|nr:hypothetical protein HDU76_003765 [Blyttiomyces sp. JEL0837]
MIGFTHFGQSFYQVLEVYVVSIALHKILPATIVNGYCCDFNGNKLIYRLNGLSTLLSIVAFYATLSFFNLKDPTFLANNFLACWISGILIGVIVSVISYIHGSSNPPNESRYNRCVTADMVISPAKNQGSSTQSNNDNSDKPQFSTFPVLDPLAGTKHPLVNFWNGFYFNPRLIGIDIKMALYSLGANLLQLNILSMAALHYSLNDGHLSNAMLVYLVTFTWFLVEYSSFENVHLYTYDLFAEKIGFKLLFGCLGFYPFAYCLGGTVLAIYTPTTTPTTALPDLSATTTILTILLFFTGWIFTRGPNMQKFYFKLDPANPICFYGLIPQRALPGTRIVVSGFWGLARHVNYMGEIIQGIALAIPGFLVTGSWILALIPWIYPIYYIGLFIPRERDDNEICRKKYGKNWETYEKMVPYRIVPFLY